jgi:prepilin-type N-terminal cleavage/methylation domain-containing protein
MRRDAGFSLVEVLVALALFLAVSGAFLHVASSGQRLARSQSEATDLNQRVRVAADRLRADIARAGTGPLAGAFPGGLGSYFAPIVPARLGARSADPALTAATDRLTLVFVPEGAWPAVLVAPMASSVAPLVIDAAEPGCPAAGLCGFAAGTRALVVDASGLGAGHELFTVTATSAGLAHDGANPAFSRPYAAGTVVVPIVQRTYYLDRSCDRLMVYDGYQSEMPFIDNVLDMRVSYFADASSASVPRPPEAAANCVFDAGSPPVPRLTDYGGGLLELAPSQLADGPPCGAGALAFDGDLLRVRRVRIALRLQAASDDVRGSGALFARPGRSPGGASYVPDFAITLDVAPRNLTPVTFAR